MTIHLPRITTLFLTCLLLTACASGPRISRIYSATDMAGAPFENILVVALFNATDTRKLLERETVKQLSARGVNAVAMTSLQKPGSVVNRDEVIRAAKQMTADAVLVTQLISFETSVKDKYRSPKAGYKFGETYYYDVYTVELREYAEPPTVFVTEDVSLQTDLYSAASKSRVWAIGSEARIKLNIEDMWDDSAFTAEATAIVDTLARDKLIGR